MRIRMSLVDPRGPAGTREFLIDTDDAADTGAETTAAPHTFGEVRGAIAALLPSGATQLSIDGSTVRDDEVLGTGRLVRGALLRASSHLAQEVVGRPHPGRMPLGTGALVEVHAVGGPGAGRIIALPRGEHLVGRSASSVIRLEDAGVSRTHALLRVDDTGVHLRDLDATNPSTVDGSGVTEGAALQPGSRIRFASTTVVVRRTVTAPAAVDEHRGVVRLNRRPRFMAARGPQTVRFPAPPERPSGLHAPVIAALSPLAISVLVALVLRSPAMLLFAMMSPVMLLAQWWGDRRNGRRSHRAQLAEFGRATEAAESRLAQALAQEAVDRQAEQPDLAIVGRVASRRDVRLWERRPGDRDHLALRVGTADQPAGTVVEGLDENAHVPVLADVPVVLHLEDSPVVGIAGPRARSLALVGALLAQVAVWHSSRTTRVVILSMAAHPEADWSWAARLPHALGDPGGPVALVASSDHEPALTARIEELAAMAGMRTEGGDRGQAAPVPHVVVVLDGAQQLRDRPGIVALLRAGRGCGLHVIAIDDVAERLPAESSAQLVLHPGPAPRATLQLADRTIHDITPDLPDRRWLESLSRAVAPLEDVTPVSGASTLPASLGLREAHRPLGLDPADVDDLVSAWTTSDGRPIAVLGATAEGPLEVDLAQAGPHCLVGGTTGSGKSELLQALVSGLAARSRPDELSLVLVDYKGGSAFKECGDLPHTLGVVTDLDERLTRRALVSLGAELKRREALLARVGAKDLDEYRRLRTADPDLPRIARLVLVVDEFKLLADELPDFVEGLVRVAAVGRSLGLHLVLATQRPAGIITGDMRANISLRIALRVRDRSDSDDVVESPAAAQISERTPGRALLRTSSGRLAELQTAFPGAPMPPADARVRRPARVHALTWTDLSRPAAMPTRAGGIGGRTELESVVSAAREAARRLGIATPPSPWLPPLPASLPVDRLAAASTGAVTLGLTDEPERQRQSTYEWHPVADGHLAIAGGSRTGRSTALRTLTAALAERWDPSTLHVHVLEGAPGSLRDLAALPHVGSVTSTADPLLAARVVARLAESLGHGQAMTAPAPASGVQGPMGPVVVVLVDGWEALEDAFEAVDHGAPTETLLRLARDGLAAGLRLVVTGGRALLSGRLASTIQRRLVLPMPDPLDLTLAGLAPDDVMGHRGAGRAIDLATRQHVQLAHVGRSPMPEEQVRAVAELAAGPGMRRPTDPSRLPWRVSPLPHTIPWTELPRAEPDRIWLGAGGDDAGPLGIGRRASRGRFVILGPPRSGRTTALGLIAHQLARLGRPTALVATRRTPLGWLSGTDGLHLVAASEGGRLQELRQAHPEVSILVDDAESLEGTAAEAAVLDALRDLDHTGAWLVAAADSRRTSSLYRGLVPELARHCTGLVLWPASPNDGELLGARVQTSRHRLPGRGALVVEGLAVPLQLADPQGGPTDRADKGFSP